MTVAYTQHRKGRAWALRSHRRSARQTAWLRRANARDAARHLNDHEEPNMNRHIKHCLDTDMLPSSLVSTKAVASMASDAGCDRGVPCASWLSRISSSAAGEKWPGLRASDIVNV